MTNTITYEHQLLTEIQWIIRKYFNRYGITKEQTITSQEDLSRRYEFFKEITDEIKKRPFDFKNLKSILEEE